MSRLTVEEAHPFRCHVFLREPFTFTVLVVLMNRAPEEGDLFKFFACRTMLGGQIGGACMARIARNVVLEFGLLTT